MCDYYSPLTNRVEIDENMTPKTEVRRTKTDDSTSRRKNEIVRELESRNSENGLSPVDEKKGIEDWDVLNSPLLIVEPGDQGRVTNSGRRTRSASDRGSKVDPRRISSSERPGREGGRSRSSSEKTPKPEGRKRSTGHRYTSKTSPENLNQNRLKRHSSPLHSIDKSDSNSKTGLRRSNSVSNNNELNIKRSSVRRKTSWAHEDSKKYFDYPIKVVNSTQLKESASRTNMKPNGRQRTGRSRERDEKAQVTPRRSRSIFKGPSSTVVEQATKKEASDPDNQGSFRRSKSLSRWGMWLKDPLQDYRRGTSFSIPYPSTKQSRSKSSSRNTTSPSRKSVDSSTPNSIKRSVSSAFPSMISRRISSDESAPSPREGRNKMSGFLASLSGIRGHRRSLSTSTTSSAPGGEELESTQEDASSVQNTSLTEKRKGKSKQELKLSLSSNSETDSFRKISVSSNASSFDTITRTSAEDSASIRTNPSDSGSIIGQSSSNGSTIIPVPLLRVTSEDLHTDKNQNTPASASKGISHLYSFKGLKQSMSQMFHSSKSESKESAVKLKVTSVSANSGPVNQPLGRSVSLALSSCKTTIAEEKELKRSSWSGWTEQHKLVIAIPPPESEDTSYEKACGDRRGSAPTTPVLGARNMDNTPSTRISLQNLFSKRSLKSNPLKRTKSVTKLERKRAPVDSVTPARLRSSRSHESLLCSGGLGGMVTTLELGGPGGDVSVTPVHPSVTSQPCIFQVQNREGMTRYYQTKTEEENNAWVYSLRKATQPHQDLQRRKENSLKICVQEAKGVAQKKKYFCEISLDTKLYGKTTSKLKAEMCLWGEQFEFNSLPAVGSIKIDLYREGDRKKKKNVHIGSVTIPVTAVSSRNMVEKWYTVSSTNEKYNSAKEQPALRIKCRFLSVDILPLHFYNEFLSYIKSCYCVLMEMLEGAVSVKAKEDIATCMVNIMHNEALVQHFLTEVVMMDVKRIDDTVLTFRGNSLATKSVEAYMKLVGEHYLRETLEKFIKKMIAEPCDCEVDPSKVSNSDLLPKNRKNLQDAVDDVWRKILESYTKFPPELRECFATLRNQMEQSGKGDMADHLISASIFLRFLCPAILYPSLFNLSAELPDSKVSRNLTLVAKTLQTLANCTQFQGKESFMEYLNIYLGNQASSMKTFLRQISTPNHIKSRHQEFHEKIDLGKQLSLLHTLICESLNKICKTYQAELERLQKILNDISARTTQPNVNMMQLRYPGTPSPQPAEGYQSLQRNIFRFNDPTVSAQDINGFSPHLHHRAATLPRGNPKATQEDYLLPGALACTNGHIQEPHSWRDNSDLQVAPLMHNNAQNKRVPIFNGGTSDPSEIRYIDESSEGGGGGAPHRGSQTSISALSNVASSGYQSFAAYSQSSSPVDPTIQQDSTPPIIPNQIRALAFNNPMYDLDGRPPNKHSPSSSLSSQSGDTPPHSSLDTPPCERRKPFLHGAGVPRTNPRCGVHGRSNHHIRDAPLTECRHPRCRPPGRRNRVSDYPVPSVYDTDSESEPESSRSRRSHRQEDNSKTFEQYERELSELQEQMEELQMKLQAAEQQLTAKKGDELSWKHQEQIQEIIHRLQNVEHAQKQELAENQQVIKAQKDQIQALGNANTQLLGMLGQLRDRSALEHRSSSC